MVLTEVPRGKRVVIKQCSQLHPLIYRRLNDFGINEGKEIFYKGKMPFGGPCFIACKSQKVSIRHCDAQCIEVEAL
ncbi:FeoA family protein [Longirhabdus pacifica]|uniref:FeoA family protein n=1 Tax=Longirhabdus pacifica TaxID=2305227 RepID=UPI001008B922|nr:FeoA family protein [Longirhabdus pacifica]